MSDDDTASGSDGPTDDPGQSGTVALEMDGERLILHPERAVLWPARRTVIVADTHFGKSAIFRRNGLAVPDGSDTHDRHRLSRLIHAVQAERLIILGDFVHASLDPQSRDVTALDAWIAALHTTEVVVIAGNHDRDVRKDWRPAVRWQEGELVEPPFCFVHDADRCPQRHAGRFTLSGHVHPVAKLGGLRTRAPRVPIFWQRARGLILPSFGVFTGGFRVEPTEGDRVFAAGPQAVVRFR